MSSGSTIMMIPTVSSAAGGGDDDNDDVECRACYGVVVAFVSLLLFCVLAATAGVVKACAVTGFAVVFFGVIGWLVPAGASTRGAGATGARRADGAAAASAQLRRAGRACRLVGAAAFAYECPAADAEGGGKPGGSALCAVCLEDVQRGEAVRRLPACGHLFHKDCVDMWLHSHTTCPLCRCDLISQRKRAEKIAPAAASSSADELPPV